MRLNNYLILCLLASTIFFLPACTKEDNSLSAELKEIEAYLKENNLFDKAQYAEQGMYYVIEEAGEGTTYPTATSLVYIVYDGRVMGSSTEFDSTNGNEVALNLGNTIYGWRVGIPKFKRMGKGKLFIPSTLGYGNVAQPGIPGGSVLEFDITLNNFVE
jgi:FKBP-type peptidyl-prolyl cis-trans isomerase FkpA